MNTVATKSPTSEKATPKNSNRKVELTPQEKEARKVTYQAKRAALRELSNEVKPLIEEGKFQNVNEALIARYMEETSAKEFKTFHQWKSEEKSVIKGQKAFVIWGKPTNIEHPDPDADEDEMEYFPLCYLFSDQQVETKVWED